MTAFQPQVTRRADLEKGRHMKGEGEEDEEFGFEHVNFDVSAEHFCQWFTKGDAPPIPDLRNQDVW